MKTLMTTALRFSSLVLVLAAPSLAQISPEENIKKILKAIDEDMREIDRLLMESSRKDAAGGMEKAAEKLKDLMQQGQLTQDQVVQDISKLIEELENMQSSDQQQSSQGQKQDQSQQSGQQQGNQERSTRQNNQTPEMVDQRGQNKPGQKEQAQEQPQGQKPQDGRDQAFQEGENRPAGARPDAGTERVERGSEDSRWGDLPKYARFLMNRGALPEVPEKYRRLVEAYQKQSHKSGTSSKSGR